MFYAGSLATAALDLLLIFVVGTHEEEGDSLDATGAWDPRWQPGWGEWGEAPCPSSGTCLELVMLHDRLLQGQGSSESGEDPGPSRSRVQCPGVLLNPHQGMWVSARSSHACTRCTVPRSCSILQIRNDVAPQVRTAMAAAAAPSPAPWRASHQPRPPRPRCLWSEARRAASIKAGRRGLTSKGTTCIGCYSGMTQPAQAYLLVSTRG